jgi:hypothetical protein
MFVISSSPVSLRRSVSLARFDALAVCAALLLACGGGNTGAPRQNAEPDAGNPLRDPEVQCLTEADLHPVLAPTALTAGTLVAQLQQDDSALYFSDGPSLYRVSKQGGVDARGSAREPNKAEELYTDPDGNPIAFTVHGSELALVAGGSLWSLPKTGGTPRMLSTLPELPASDPLSGTVSLVFDANAAYYAADSAAAAGIPLYAVQLADGSAQRLGHAADAPTGLARVAEALYWSAPAAASDPYTAALWSVPSTGGAAQKRALDLGKLRLDFSLLTGVADQLFLDVTLNLGADNRANAAVSAPGLYRVGKAGGRATQLLESPILDLGSVFGLAPAERVVAVGKQLWLLAGSLEVADVYSLTDATAAPEKRFCLNQGDATVLDMTADEHAVYLVLSRSDDTTVILRRDL